MNDDHIRSYFNQTEYEFLALREKANRLELPNDVIDVINSWVEHAEILSDELEQKKIILKELRRAKIQYENGDVEQVKLCLFLARKNFENAKHDERVLGIERQFGKDADARRRKVEEVDEPRWDEWKAAAAVIQSGLSRKMSKRQLAEKIKAQFNLTYSVETIRKRI